MPDKRDDTETPETPETPETEGVEETTGAGYGNTAGPQGDEAAED